MGRRLLALILGVLGALFLGEGLARLVAPPPLATMVRAGIGEGMAMPVPDGRVFAGRPGFSDASVTLDEHGLRPVPSPVASPHVVVLGDSVAFGHGVAADLSWPAVLAAELPARVTNLSFPGWNTAQEAAALAHLDPSDVDAVVVGWVANDRASLEWDRTEDGAPAMYVDREARVFPALDRDAQLTLWQRSHLWRLLARAAAPEVVSLTETDHDDALARIDAWAREHGVPVFLLLTPPWVDRAGWEAPWGPGRPTAPHQREPALLATRSAAEALGWTVIDGTEAQAGVRPSTLALDPVHPNAAGHERLGRVVARRLAAQPIGDEPR